MKIFCISYQRTGTTSTGTFFKQCGYKVAGWDINTHNNWTFKWADGQYDDIVNCPVFNQYQVFEDDPWWCLDFYRYLYHKIPDSYFILFERDSNKWYNSMMSHSKGKTLGNTYLHCLLYNRLPEYHALNTEYSRASDNLLLLNEDYREHYTAIYETRNSEVKDFFKRHDSSRFINLQLEDPDKWVKLAEYFNINNTPKHDVWVNPKPI